MRKTITVFASLTALLLLVYTSFRSYQVWKQNHTLALARQSIAQTDYRTAFLALQQVLKTNPQNVEATRLLANLMEVQHLPATLNWRERVVELAPDSLADRLALAKAAIVSQDYALATNALAGVSEADKNTGDYQNLAGTAALIGGNPAAAETFFSKAISLDPANLAPQVSLAVVRLHWTNVLDMAEARIALQRVIQDSTNATLRGQARRELVNDAMRFNDLNTALRLSRDQAEQTNAPFTDKLLRLDVLTRAKSPELQSALIRFQNEAATDTEKIAALTEWQTAKLSTRQALDWLESLPLQTRTNQTVQVAAAVCRLQMNDYAGLQKAIQPEHWTDASHPWNDFEFMRHAFLAYSLRGQGLHEAAAAEWTVATKSATEQKYSGTQKSSLKKLFELAVGWTWNTEAEQILWTVINQYPDERWAYPALRNALIGSRRTQSLMQLLSIMAKRDANDISVKNDLAATAMLLGAQELKPYALAAEVYEKAPKNPYYVSTYAFSLYLQKKYGDSLKVMQQLAPKDLRSPAIAGYYGLILLANGDKATAKSYLNLVSKAPVLPEEQVLFEQARMKL